MGHCKTNVSLISALLVMAIASVGKCSVVSYTSESNFLAALSSSTMESFESFNAAPPTPADSFTMTGFTMSALPAPGFLQPQHTPALHGELGPDFTLNIAATDGTAFVRYDSDAWETLQFTLNSPQQGFGLNVVDWGDYGIGSLILSDDLGHSFTVATTLRADGNQLFFGIVSTTPFTKISLLSQPVLNSFGIDEIYYGPAAAAVVPEPTSFVIFLVATVGMLAFNHSHLARRNSRNGRQSSSEPWVPRSLGCNTTPSYSDRPPNNASSIFWSGVWRSAGPNGSRSDVIMGLNAYATITPE